MSPATYISRQKRLMKGFGRSLSRVRHTLVARYGEEEADLLIRESSREYEALIPQIPRFGDDNIMHTLFLLPASRYVAIYRAFQGRGRSVEEAGRLAYEIAEADMNAIPGPVRHLIGLLWFSRWLTRRMRWRAATTQARAHPGDYVIEYVQGDGREFDYGIDYIQCASLNFYRQQGAAAMAPYPCAIDRLASEKFGWGLRRTQTLAEGGQRCDFRFKKGGRTCVPIPSSLEEK